MMSRALGLAVVLLGAHSSTLAQCEPTWLSGGSAEFNNEVRALVPWNNGLIATGTFTQVGANPASGVAYWDNNEWAPLGSQLTGQVLTAADHNGTLFVGGGFTGPSSGNIAKLSGTTWTSAGAGFNSWVNALIVHNGDLYAGGYFTQSGSSAVSRVARWTGSGWVQVGAGLPGTVYDLAIYQGRLIACGSFTTAEGAPAMGIAQWDGAHWTPIQGASFSSPPKEMAVLEGKLLVTGYLAGRGYLNSYDGTTWRNEFETNWLAPAGFAQYQGASYVGGASTLLSNPGPGWEQTSPLFTSPGYTTVSCMTVHRGVLFVGGYFTSAGGTPASMIARYYLPSADFNHDGDFATDADIEAFFACLAGDCCATCGDADFDADGSTGTDADIEAFFRVLAGGCA